MKRREVFLSDQHDEALREYAYRHRVTVSAVIRHCLEQTLGIKAPKIHQGQKAAEAAAT